MMMHCQRCGGLLVPEVLEDVVNGDCCEMVRCVNCGELVDGLVAARRTQTVPAPIGPWARRGEGNPARPGQPNRKDHFFAQAVRDASVRV